MANKAIASEYTAYAQALRHALLVQSESGQCHERAKAYLLALFKDMDENGDGVLSVDEFKAFVQSLRLTISEDCVEQDPEKFADILVQQIDINHDDTISHSELANFLWPAVETKREIGVVIAIFHQAFINSLFGGVDDYQRVLESINMEDLVLMKAFAEKAKVKLLRGNLIEVRALKKAFSKLMCASLGLLSHYEIDMLLKSLDANSDGVVSPREFKQWLLRPTGMDHEDFDYAAKLQTEKEEKEQHEAVAAAKEAEKQRLEEAGRLCNQLKLEEAEAAAFEKSLADAVASETRRIRQEKKDQEEDAAEKNRLFALAAQAEAERSERECQAENLRLENEKQKQEKRADKELEEANKAVGIQETAEDSNDESLNWRLYSIYAKALRKALLTHADASGNDEGAKRVLQAIFSSMDKDNDGKISVGELRAFIGMLSVEPVEGVQEDLQIHMNSDKFASVLIQQIDINHDGSISHDELSNFLWPKVQSEREVGVVLEVVRQSLLSAFGDKCWRGDEFVLIELFAEKSNIILMRGDLIDVRRLRLALGKMMTMELEALSHSEIDAIVEALDVNEDGVVSPAEFKSWLLLDRKR